MVMARKRFAQRPIKGGRVGLPATVLGRIWDAVDEDARFHNVSRSFVIACRLAAVYNVSGQEDYRTAAAERARAAAERDKTQARHRAAHKRKA
jgi:hypothetical protein